MPISALGECSAEHWLEVKQVIVDAVESIEELRFTPRLVSDADEVGVIQKRIIQNVYNSTIVVCDVSGKNPNVMFELGLRLAFDKPTVIIKDDKTDYSFDTGVIEHVAYPRDLRFSKIVDFKKKLADKVLHTYKASVGDPGHSPFLKSFGQFHIASLPQTETSADGVIMEMLSDLFQEVRAIKHLTASLDSVDRRPHSTASLIFAILSDHCNRLGLDPLVAARDSQFLASVNQQLKDRFRVHVSRQALTRMACLAAEELRLGRTVTD